MSRTSLSSDDAGEQLDAMSLHESFLQDLNNRFIAGQQEALHLAPDALYRQQGADALQAASRAREQLAELADALREEAESEGLGEAFDRIVRSHHRAVGESIRRYAQDQAVEWQRRVLRRRIELAQNQGKLTYVDPARVDIYAEVSRGAALEIAQLDGHAPQSAVAQERATRSRSALYRAALEEALGKGDSGPAYKLYEGVESRLIGPDASSVRSQIEIARQTDTARDWISTSAPAPREMNIVFDAPRRIADVLAWQANATARNETEWAHDFDQRATVQHAIDITACKAVRDYGQTDAELESEVTNWVSKPDADGEPQTNRPPPILWSQLSLERKRAVDAILAQNARGIPSAEPPVGSVAAELDPAAPSPQRGAAAPTMAVPAAGAVGESVLSALPGVARAAVAPVGAAATVMLAPGNSNSVTPYVAEGLRLRVAPGDLDGVLERRVREGMFGTGIGEHWEALPVKARIDSGPSGKLLVDAAQLVAALGPEEAKRLLTSGTLGWLEAAGGGVAAASPRPSGDTPPPLPIPNVQEIRIGVSADSGTTVSFHETTDADVEEVCRGYPTFFAMAQNAAAGAKADGMVNGAAYGIRVHEKVKKTIKSPTMQDQLHALGIFPVHPEIALLNGIKYTYRPKGSGVLDIMEISGKNTICVYDIKTGGAKFPDAKMRQYAEEAGKFAMKKLNWLNVRVFVIPIHTQ